MNDNRTPVISRTYEKGTDRIALFVCKIAGENISGQVFRYERWLNNQEQQEERIESGNKYAIRKAFIYTLLDLHEDGWKRVNAGLFGTEGDFFNPEGL